MVSPTRAIQGILTAAISFGLLGSVSALWDNPFFMRMTPAGDFEIGLLFAMSVLLGAYVAIRRPFCSMKFAGGGSVIGFIGIACPVCNKVLLLLFTMISGIVFFYALIIVQATLSFWATESLEIMNTLTYGGVETATYPLSIYRRWFRRFFTFVVPLGCISYFPAVAIFGIEDPLGTSLAFQICAPVAGYLFFAASLFAWRFGILHYTSTGS